LVLNIDILCNESRADNLVNVGDSLENTLSSPLGIVSITEFDSLVLTCMQMTEISSYLVNASNRGYEPVEAPDGTIAR
jgi:hypothetical protein